MKIRIGSSLLVIAAILLGTACMSAQDVIKLPQRDISPKVIATVPAFHLFSTGGGEIYKVSARYPTQPTTIIPGKITVVWNGGPVGAPTQIFLINMKNWVVIAPIWSGINTGGVQSVQWTIPANFNPTNDHDMVGTFPNLYGQYCIYIQTTNQSTWTYGPDFYIVWDY